MASTRRDSMSSQSSNKSPEEKVLDTTPSASPSASTPARPYDLRRAPSSMSPAHKSRIIQEICQLLINQNLIDLVSLMDLIALANLTKLREILKNAALFIRCYRN